MSVPKYRRSHSKLDAFMEAVKLRHIVIEMVLRSFGMKTKEHRRLVTPRMRERFPQLAKKFDQIDEYQTVVEETKELNEYEKWVTRKVRDNLFKYCANLVAHISAANGIRCVEEFEYRERIILEDRAIEDIENIKQEVQFIEEFYDINLNRYMGYSEQLEKTKTYLYNWKKSTIKEYNKFLQQRREQYAKLEVEARVKAEREVRQQLETKEENDEE